MLREIYEQPQALERTLDLYLSGQSLKPEVAARLAHWPNSPRAKSSSPPAAPAVTAVSTAKFFSKIFAASRSTSNTRANTVAAAAQGYVDCAIPACSSSRNPAKPATRSPRLKKRIARATKLSPLPITPSPPWPSKPMSPCPWPQASKKPFPPPRASPASWPCSICWHFTKVRAWVAWIRPPSPRTSPNSPPFPASSPRNSTRWREQAAALAAKYASAITFLYLGRGIHYAIAREGALKLKESSYVHAEGYPVGELKHGPNALVSDRVPLVVLATVDRTLRSLSAALRKNSAASRRHESAGRARHRARQRGRHGGSRARGDCIFIPQASEYLLPILEVVPLQLFAYFMALEHGVDVDRPRNLSKAVVEK
jgi:glucosamine--fructose-6-phosphate aminotransferase (isomerizing)